MSEPNEYERNLAHCVVDRQPWGPHFETAEERRQDRADREECVARALAAYRAELTAPAKVCEAFERLMRGALVPAKPRYVAVTLWQSGLCAIDAPCGSVNDAPSLAVAYAAVAPARDTAPSMSPARTAELAQDDADTLAADVKGEVE
jgi:hypothetical protein